MKFTKMHGCGNDYIYFDCFRQSVPEPEKLAAPEKKPLPAAEAKPEAEAVKPPEWFKDAVRPQRRSRDEVMAYLRGKADGDGR